MNFEDLTAGEIREMIKVDPTALEKEVQRQSSIYYNCAEYAANARKDRDSAVDRLEIRSAEIELGFRRNPPADVKVTETSIKSLVVADPEVQDLMEAVVKANNILSKAEGLVRAMDHKKASLDNATYLWRQGLYQDPAGRHSESEVAAGVRQGLNHRNRQGD